MRRRVLLPLALLGLLTVIAILFPVSQAISHERTDQLRLQRTATIDRILQRAAGPVAGSDASSLQSYLDRLERVYGERAVVVDDADRVVASSGGMRAEGKVEPALDAALRGVDHADSDAILPWSADTAVFASPVLSQGTSPIGAVALEANLTRAKGDVTRQLAMAGTAGLGVLAAVLLASVWWTHWVLRPVRALDLAANALAEQEDYRPAAVTGPPELRRLSRSFQRMAQHVEDTLEQQRGLVAATSHQLRNPLAAVRMRLDAMTFSGADALDAAVDRNEIAAIDRDLDRLERTIDRILELARAEHRANQATSPNAADSPTDEYPIITAEELADAHRAAALGCGLTLKAVPSAARPRFSRQDLDEILAILVDNAGKYAGPEATMTLAWEQSASTATLTISDDGPGLTDHELEHLGTRFWRARNHSSLPGSGLGHAIVLQLARANRATVATDRGTDGGLRIRIRTEQT
ncbi:MAG: sensor histidine kinase [Galactobacter sp.]|uniref:sensor histidine kinase n=1 Tax=Galactobacter sp. TaxID=2676125 RepID=UPI0025C0F2C2|nr:HAMP domain-containing sensor histidine kinase [Galactobacter sp.]